MARKKKARAAKKKAKRTTAKRKPVDGNRPRRSHRGGRVPVKGLLRWTKVS